MKTMIELLGGGVMTMMTFVLMVDCDCLKKKIPLSYLCQAEENDLSVRLVKLWHAICVYCRICGETSFHQRTNSLLHDIQCLNIKAYLKIFQWYKQCYQMRQQGYTGFRKNTEICLRIYTDQIRNMFPANDQNCI